MSKRLLGLILGALIVAAMSTATGFAAGLAAQRLSAPAAVTSSSHSISQVITVTDPADITTTSTTFADIPGMTASVTVPSLKTAQLVITFSDESACYNGVSSDWCSVIVLVDGVEAAPAAGTDYAFDGSDGAACCKWRGMSLTRVAQVGSGTHLVEVQWAVVPALGGTNLTLWSGERALVILRSLH